MSNNVTINQVAQAAGVSIQTVSRVINNRYDVAAETRQRVQQAIERLGYQPNAIARGLASRRSRTLGLVTYDFNDPFFTLAVTGAEEEAHKHDYFFLLGSSNCSVNDIPKYMRLLNERHVEGVIFAREGGEDEQEQIMRLVQEGTPLVMVGFHYLNGLFNSVDIDNIQGGLAATRFLIQSGHRKIACVSGPAISQSAKDRLTGYRTALEEYGLDYDPELVAEGAYGMASHGAGYKAMKTLLARRPDITAVFCQNDRMAVGAVSAIRQSGQRVPEDISVVGYDDTADAEFASPPLTTIRQPTIQVGVEAVRLMLRILSDPGRAPEQVMLPTELIERDSVTRLRSVETVKGGPR